MTKKKTLLISTVTGLVLFSASLWLTYGKHPLSTKIQTRFGLPFVFFERGVFPWLGDLEEHRFFHWHLLVLDLLFWIIIPFAIIQIYYGILKRKRSPVQPGAPGDAATQRPRA
ncbi:MAG: hypothetical protein WCU88_08250 [Elusimicrobiota bacterium]|jgi:hypothetical protein